MTIALNPPHTPGLESQVFLTLSLALSFIRTSNNVTTAAGGR